MINGRRPTATQAFTHNTNPNANSHHEDTVRLRTSETTSTPRGMIDSNDQLIFQSFTVSLRFLS